MCSIDVIIRAGASNDRLIARAPGRRHLAGSLASCSYPDRTSCALGTPVAASCAGVGTDWAGVSVLHPALVENPAHLRLRAGFRLHDRPARTTPAYPRPVRLDRHRVSLFERPAPLLHSQPGQ